MGSENRSFISRLYFVKNGLLVTLACPNKPPRLGSFNFTLRNFRPFTPFMRYNKLQIAVDKSKIRINKMRDAHIIIEKIPKICVGLLLHRFIQICLIIQSKISRVWIRPCCKAHQNIARFDLVEIDLTENTCVRRWGPLIVKGSCNLNLIHPNTRTLIILDRSFFFPILPQYPGVCVHFHLFAMSCHKDAVDYVPTREHAHDTSPNVARLLKTYQ